MSNTREFESRGHSRWESSSPLFAPGDHNGHDYDGSGIQEEITPESVNQEVLLGRLTTSFRYKH